MSIGSLCMCEKLVASSLKTCSKDLLHYASCSFAPASDNHLANSMRYAGLNETPDPSAES